MLSSFVPLRFLALALPLLLPLCASSSESGELSKTTADGWKYALRETAVALPRDHRIHRDFKTEWWYFTGNLSTETGRRFGYRITFFRHGLRLPGLPQTTSRFIQESLMFGHFGLTDVAQRKFLFHQEIARGAFGEAGFGPYGSGEGRIAWLNQWELREISETVWDVTANQPGARLTLRLEVVKPWVLNGEAGWSQKSAGHGNASHYYSGTRLRSSGRIEFLDANGAVRTQETVTGESWFDHEWASNQLASDQVGWDWFSIQFADGTELMLYQLRLRDGSADPASSGTWIAKDGTTRHLTRDELFLERRSEWKSPHNGARYPIGWGIRIPSLGLDLEVSTPVADQELRLSPIAYWEGLIDVRGTREGRPITGHGYLELTGYNGPIVGLQPIAAP